MEMSDWTKEINYETINESLREIDEIDVQSPDLVKLISIGGLPAEELAAEILRSPDLEQEALVSAISEDKRFCGRLYNEQKQWTKMKRKARFEFLVSLHDNIRCINLERVPFRQWSTDRIKQVFDLLCVRYTEIAQRASDLLIWLQNLKQDTFCRTLESVVDYAVSTPVPKNNIKNILQRNNPAVARAFFYSPTKGFDKAPSSEEVTDWIGNRGEIIFPLVVSPYRRIFVAYVDVPKSKNYIEALWLNLEPDDHFFVVTKELKKVDKLGRIRHELGHFCESAFIKNVM
jgi:hypothetical protein